VTGLIAGNAPDIFEIGSTWGPQFSQSGVVYEITDWVREFQNEYLMWEPVTEAGKIYGMPWLVGTRFILYNKTLFKKAGLDPERPPKTWDDLIAYAEKIDRLSPEIYGYGISVAEDYSPWQTFIPYLWNNGGDVLSADWRRSVFDSKASREAFHFYQRLKKYSVLNRLEQIDQLFSAGRVGMILSGAWNFKAIAKTNSSLEYGVAQVPTPGADQKGVSFAGGEMLVILGSTKYPKEAFEFVRYLASKEVELAISKAQKNVLPSLKAALSDSYYQTDPHMKGFVNQMLYTRPTPAHIEWFSIGKVFQEVIDRIILQNDSIDKVLSTSSEKINRILNKTQKKGGYSDQGITLWIFAGVFLFLIIVILFQYRRFSFGKASTGEASTWFFLSPWILLFLVFSLYPLVYSLIISFADYNVLTSRFSFNGIENYLKTVTDPEFLKAVGHTLLFAVGTIPFTLTISLALAVLIDRGVPFKSLFQAGFFLPVVTSIIVIATLFTYFYSESGFLNYLLGAIGIQPPQPAWLINRRWALISIMAMAVWSSCGYFLILFLAALQSIPKELYEASRLDGAGSIQQFFKITLPQLRPMMLFVVVINTINSLQVFPEIFTMTKGGPSRSTTTIVYHLYEKGFSEFQMGLASAVAYLLAGMICLFAYAQMKALRERA
jgi:multiple sugar transport system permease protein